MRTITKRTLSSLNRIIPKRNLILFTSFPNYSDSAYSLYLYMLNNGYDKKYYLVWTIDSNDNFSAKGINKKSIKGLWLFLRAKYIISTHDYFNDVYSSNEQTQINLWHGNGFKYIPADDIEYRGDYSIVTSDIFMDIASNKMKLDKDRIWITGLPRNDNLFKNQNVLNKISKHKYDKVIIWLPTYRKSHISNTCDGDEQVFGLKNIIDNDLNDLQDRLSLKNVLLIVKAHPMDELSLRDNIVKDNVLIINDSYLKKNDINLYDLLAETDALISDYSSVAIDYLLLDKPIAMMCTDIKEYESNRGFVLNPIKDYLPGPIINNYEQLLDFILRLDTNQDKWIDKRKKLKDLFHKYQDGNSCKRVCDRIFGDKL